jgi:hypothetical protein
MTTASSRGQSPYPRALQFRLATLLIAMAWAGLVSLGLRTPNALLSGVIAVLTLLTVLMAILFVIYRTGRTRAMAIGFLVFCVGYLAYLAILAGTLSAGLRDLDTPVGEAFHLLFRGVHPEKEIIATPTVALDADPSLLPRTVRIPQPPPYDPRNFLAICNHALACLLGIAGAIFAQVLYATR